jgi:hypothetical protein
MKEQLVLIRTKDNRPGCNFSRSPVAETWYVNIRITDSERFPFVYCDQCSRPTCYRRRHQGESN